jgi:predicted ATPase/DNA-binding SARP family transcriptional activator
MLKRRAMLTATLSIHLFGLPRFSCERPLAGSRSAKTLAFLAYVLLHREHRLEREKIAFMLWPDETEENALANVRRSLYLAQRWLPEGPAWLIADRRSIQWNAEAPYRLDVEEYDRLVAAGRTADAVEIYSGDLLQGLDDEWLQELRDRYRQTQLRLIASCIAQMEEAGDVPTAIAMARRGLQIDPWHEEFVRAILRLRAASGDRAGALAEYRTFERAIENEMGVAPADETKTLYERVRDGNAPQQKPALRKHNLPTPLSSFVGREQESADVVQLAASNRLTTVLGPGGVGKTRLALRVAADLQQSHPDGTWFVDATPLADERDLLRSVAATLKLHTLEGADLLQRIADDLAERRVLLVLDNCERIIDACANFAAYTLPRCPHLRIVATSRERLRVPGEAMYELAPLREADAVQLFRERAAAAGAGVKFAAEDEPALHAVCARLEGIPLAIELAAGRLRMLSVAQIHERLDDRFSLLRTSARAAIPHQQTLRATIDWSYALLTAAERDVLDRLAVFAGSISLEAITAVCAGKSENAVLDTMEQLAEKSLVLVDRARTRNRYRLLDSVREYLVDKLRERGELQSVQAAHLAYFVDFAEGLQPELTRAAQAEAMAALTLERDNLRAAFSWATDDRDYLRMRLRLASALRWFYWFRGLFELARERLCESLNRYGFESSAVYARALATYGFFVLQQGDTAGAIAALERAKDAFAGDEAQVERTMIDLQLGIAKAFAGAADAAAELLEHGLQRARSSADPWLYSYALALEGMRLGMVGRRAESVALLGQALELCEDTGESFQSTFWLLNLAVQQYHLEPSLSVEMFVRCGERAIRDGNARAVAGAFEGLGWCLACAGEMECASRTLGAAEQLREDTSQPLLPQWQAAHHAVLRALDGYADKRACANARAEGVQLVRDKQTDRIFAQAKALLSAPKQTGSEPHREPEPVVHPREPLIQRG